MAVSQVTGQEKVPQIDFTASSRRSRPANVDAILDWSRYHEGASIAKQATQMGISLPIFGGEAVRPVKV